MKGANWRHPYGPKSNINALDNHPVVHVAYSRRAGLRAMGRQGSADRGRMGIRRARRTRRRRVRLGRRVHARRQAPWPTPGRANFPHAESLRRRLRAHLAGDGVSAERLRRPRHDRQCLGVDDRLVLAEARGRRAEGVLHSGKSARRRRGGELRPLPAADQDSRARSSKAARISARRTTAAATARPRAMRRRSIRRRATSDFDASFEQESVMMSSKEEVRSRSDALRIISISVLAVSALLGWDSAMAQQTTGVPGSPSATTTIDGKVSSFAACVRW